MIVVYYDSDTGKATTLLTAPDLAGFPPPPEGQLALMLPHSVCLPGYVEDFVFHTQPESPSDEHVFDWSSKQWIDPRGIDDFKAEKWKQVKALRDAREFGSFAWNGYIFDADVESQRRLNLAVISAQYALMSSQPWSVDWTLADNTVITMTASDMVAAVSAMQANINEAHVWARAIRALIVAASSVEELDALVLSELE